AERAVRTVVVAPGHEHAWRGPGPAHAGPRLDAHHAVARQREARPLAAVHERVVPDPQEAEVPVTVPVVHPRPVVRRERDVAPAVGVAALAGGAGREETLPAAVPAHRRAGGRESV